MRPGLALCTAVLILAGGFVVVRAQSNEPFVAATVVVQSDAGDKQWQQQLLLERLDDSARFGILTCVLAGSFLLSLSAFLGRRFDWQNMAPEITCRHCLKVHGWLGALALGADSVSLGALFYIAFLPFASAVKAEGMRPDAVAITSLLAVAFLAALATLGFLTRLIVPNRTGASRTDFSVNLFAGARLSALAAGIALLMQGLHSDSVSVRMDTMFGNRLGERLLAAIGSTAIRDTALVLVFAFVASEILRWAAPMVLGSKPLMFTKLTKPVKTVTA